MSVVRGCRRAPEEGTAMVLALIAIVIMTLLGLALTYVSTTEGRMASSGSTVSKSLYSADSGVQWTATRMIEVGTFFTKPEFTTVGYTEFRLPDHLKSELSGSPNIIVRIQAPALLGRRVHVGGSLNIERSQFTYDYQVVSQSRDSAMSATKTLQADVEVGPLSSAPPGYKP
jgi:hypothetical protein